MTTDDEKRDALETAIASLRAAGSRPPSAAWDYLVEWEGPEATRELIDLMHEGDQGAIHAVRILGERGDPRSLEPMIARLTAGDVDKLMRDELTFAFHKFGATALDPLLTAHEEAKADGDPDRMLTLLEAALETGGHSRRLSEALANQVAHHPGVVRRMLAEYRATDEVVDLLEAQAAAIPDADDADRPDGEAIQAIWNTIEQLGGEVPEKLRREMRPTTDGPTSAAEAYIRND